MVIQEALKKDIIKDKIACRVIGVFVFTILVSLGAFVRIPLPFSPVPITLQTFFVLLAGLILGGGLGAASQIFYIIFGIAGFPIFAGAGFGLFYLLGPTGGYLFGFILVSFLIGHLARKIESNLGTFVIIMLGSLAILICGGTWLKILFNMSFNKAFFLGILPFIPGDIIKSILAFVVYKRLSPRTREIF